MHALRIASIDCKKSKTSADGKKVYRDLWLIIEVAIQTFATNLIALMYRKQLLPVCAPLLLF